MSQANDQKTGTVSSCPLKVYLHSVLNVSPQLTLNIWFMSLHVQMLYFVTEDAPECLGAIWRSEKVALGNLTWEQGRASTEGKSSEVRVVWNRFPSSLIAQDNLSSTEKKWIQDHLLYYNGAIKPLANLSLTVEPYQTRRNRHSTGQQQTLLPQYTNTTLTYQRHRQRRAQPQDLQHWHHNGKHTVRHTDALIRRLKPCTDGNNACTQTRW